MTRSLFVLSLNLVRLLQSDLSMKFFITVVVMLLSSCAFVKVEHEEGKLPRMTISTGHKECKIRLKDDEIKYKCKWKFN
jgi:hypothetical protein